MQNPIGQLVAAKDGGRWVLGMVIKPVDYADNQYHIEWYYGDNAAFLNLYRRSMHIDTLQEHMRAYQNKVRLKVYKGIFRQEN